MIAPVETDYATRADFYAAHTAWYEATRAARLAAERAALARRVDAAMAAFDFASMAEVVVQRYGCALWPETQAVLDLFRATSRDRDAYQQAAKACYYSGLRRDGWQSTVDVGRALGALAYGMVEALEGRTMCNVGALCSMIQSIGPAPHRRA